MQIAFSYLSTRAWRGFVDLVTPSLCLSCAAPVGEPSSLCVACWGRLKLIEEPVCNALGTPFAYDQGEGALSAAALSDPPAWDRSRAAVLFEGGNWDKLVTLPLKTLEGDGKAYVAEGSYSSDGRFVLFCSLESGDGDLYIRDLKTGARTCIVAAPGYDGGPFFSPDGKRICYRSDRNKDNLLQVQVNVRQTICAVVIKDTSAKTASK